MLNRFATRRLIDASATLDSADRALLNIWINRGLDDAAMARMTGLSEETIAERRDRVVAHLSDELGLPPEHVRSALTEIAVVPDDPADPHPAPPAEPDDPADAQPASPAEADAAATTATDTPAPDSAASTSTVAPAASTPADPPAATTPPHAPAADPASTPTPAEADATPRPRRRRRAAWSVLALGVVIVAVVLIIALGSGGSSSRRPAAAHSRTRPSAQTVPPASASTSASAPTSTTTTGAAASSGQSAVGRLIALPGGAPGASGTVSLERTPHLKLNVTVSGLPRAVHGHYEIFLYDTLVSSQPLGRLRAGVSQMSVPLPPAARRYPFIDIAFQPPGAVFDSGDSVLRAPNPLFTKAR